jgi:hypothetical protein
LAKLGEHDKGAATSEPRDASKEPYCPSCGLIDGLHRDYCHFAKPQDSCSAELEAMSEQLHVWYLEGTRELDPASYNPKAQKSYVELNEQQKEIDRYIAKKVLAALAAERAVSGKYRDMMLQAQAAIEKLPEQLLETQRQNPAWSKSEFWGIERDIVPALRLLITQIDATALAKHDAAKNLLIKQLEQELEAKERRLRNDAALAKVKK